MYKNEKTIKTIKTARSTKIISVFEGRDGKPVHRMREIGHAFGVPKHIPDEQIKKYLDAKYQEKGNENT